MHLPVVPVIESLHPEPPLSFKPLACTLLVLDSLNYRLLCCEATIAPVTITSVKIAERRQICRPPLLFIVLITNDAFPLCPVSDRESVCSLIPCFVSSLVGRLSVYIEITVRGILVEQYNRNLSLTTTFFSNMQSALVLYTDSFAQTLRDGQRRLWSPPDDLTLYGAGRGHLGGCTCYCTAMSW